MFIFLVFIFQILRILIEFLIVIIIEKIFGIVLSNVIGGKISVELLHVSMFSFKV